MRETVQQSAPRSPAARAGAGLRQLSEAIRSIARALPRRGTLSALSGDLQNIAAAGTPEPVATPGNTHSSHVVETGVLDVAPSNEQAAEQARADEKRPAAGEAALADLREDDSVAVRGRLALRIHDGFYAGLRALSRSTRDEFTLFGLLVDDPTHHELYIPNILLLPRQTCTSVSTDVAPDAMMEIMQQAALERQEIPGAQLAVWGHHHGNMECFWSQTDLTTMETRFAHADKVLSIVFNRRGHLLARLCMFRPVRLDIDIDCVRIGPSWAEEQALRDDLAGKVNGHGGGRNGRNA
jgi:hypothetical protein